MLRSPRLRADIGYRRIEEDAGILVDDFSERVVHGPLFCDLLGCLSDSSAEAGTAIDDLSDRFGAAEVQFALLELERLGVLAEADGHFEQDGFWGLLNLDGGTVRAQLAAIRAHVVGLGTDPEGFAQQLRDCGIGGVSSASGVTRQSGPPLHLTIVLASDYLHPDLAAFNRRAISEGRSWMLCRPGGGRALVGPLFQPDTGPCWQCLSIRLAAMNGFAHGTPRESSLQNHPRAMLPVAARAIEGIMAVEAVKTLMGDTKLHDQIVSFDWRTLKTALHPVAGDPGCHACRRSSPRDTAPMAQPRLEARPIWPQPDGGYRAEPAEKTLSALEKLVSPVVGPIRSVYTLDPNAAFRGRLTGPGLPQFYAALHYFPGGSVSTRLGSDAVPLATSVGKGLSEAQARVSCLAEAVERMSGLYRGDEPSLIERHVSCEQAIHPADLLHYSDRQYADRKSRQALPYSTAPEALDGDRTIEWTRVWSLTKRAWRLVPSALLFYNFPADRGGFGVANSNGDAAGNCLEEAILQGLFELVERDAVAVWWYNMVRRPAVDPGSIDDIRIRSQLDAYAALGRKAWVLDLTHDLGIPVFAAVSFEQDGTQPAFGFGAHLDPGVAMGRAVSEMSQMMFMLAQPVDETQAAATTAIRYFLDGLTLADAPYFDPAEGPQRNLSEIGKQGSGDLRTDIDGLVSKFARLGLEICVHDRTRAEFGLSVVKVIVPGLRHFWPRFAPGRLFDVPVALGWLDETKTEDELNPRPILF